MGAYIHTSIKKNSSYFFIPLFFKFFQLSKGQMRIDKLMHFLAAFCKNWIEHKLCKGKQGCAVFPVDSYRIVNHHSHSPPQKKPSLISDNYWSCLYMILGYGKCFLMFFLLLFPLLRKCFLCWDRGNRDVPPTLDTALQCSLAVVFW